MLRRHVALVTQEHHIFIGTVRENLALAKPEATDDEIVRALDAVDALEWVQALPTGFSPNSARPATKSPRPGPTGGARATGADDPHTLVLDEATAMAGSASGASSGAFPRGRAAGANGVAIAHRLHTAHDADRVCVVIDGKIAELGTHDELVALNGEYASLWSSWRNEKPGPSRISSAW